jgi:hypothetical protein
MTVSLNLDRGAFGFGGVQQMDPSNRAGGGERPQSLETALSALVQSMTDSKGKVNGDNPLVKLLTELLQNLEKNGSQAQGGGNAPGGGTPLQNMAPDQLKEVLSQLLEMLGGGAGAGGNGFGGGAGGAGGASGAGGGDILSQLLGALTQAKLGSLLQPSTDGTGGATFKEGDKELLKQVAQFMDQSGAFGKPDNADGNVKSWADELSEKSADGTADTTLSAEEAGKFQQALQMLGSQAASGGAPASGMLANSGIPISSSDNSGGGGLGNNGGFGGGGSVGQSGGLGGGATVTMGLDDLLQLLQGQGGNATQGSGPSAQDQALQEDARNAAGSIMSKLFS